MNMHLSIRLFPCLSAGCPQQHSSPAPAIPSRAFSLEALVLLVLLFKGLGHRDAHERGAHGTTCARRYLDATLWKLELCRFNADPHALVFANAMFDEVLHSYSCFVPC